MMSFYEGLNQIIGNRRGERKRNVMISRDPLGKRNYVKTFSGNK